jgi:hypothetical protein
MRVKATASGRVARGRVPMASGALAVLGILGVLAGCGGSGPAPTVPSISQAAGGGTQAAGGSRGAQLHAAAQCIREHGIPGYADPVLTPGGAVYSDARSIEDASESAVNAARAACGTLMAEAGLTNPESEPPAPPQLVRAGVRAAECERRHGLPDIQDPSAHTLYTPGHGFGMQVSEIPAGGKLSHGFQQAARACHTLIAAEIRASTLSSLGNDG